MRAVLIKVYGAFSPIFKGCEDAVAKAGSGALGHESPWLCREGELLQISFEGVFFPVEDVLRALGAHLSPEASGKLDVLDLEAWTLTRHVRENGIFRESCRNINQVLEYSGH